MFNRGILILTLILSSCSSTKLLNRAIKKDPTILHNTTIRDTIQITKVDSIPYIVNDTILYKLVEKVTDTIVEFKYKHITAPITRQQTRLNEREERLELKYRFKLGKIVAKYEGRIERLNARLLKRTTNVQVRQENKKSTWYWFFIIGLLIGAFVVLYIKR
jgi:hypothetical protein